MRMVRVLRHIQSSCFLWAFVEVLTVLFAADSVFRWHRVSALDSGIAARRVTTQALQCGIGAARATSSSTLVEGDVHVVFHLLLDLPSCAARLKTESGQHYESRTKHYARVKRQCLTGFSISVMKAGSGRPSVFMKQQATISHQPLSQRHNGEKRNNKCTVDKRTCEILACSIMFISLPFSEYYKTTSIFQVSGLQLLQRSAS